ncbi:MAG TPA: glycosyltransferase [Candidatus Babeliales bacterium]|nr:glycosyltransferase [Candidatus Babeliales bacterium]HLC07214.1 glycosyltransferase [Candidatus Babeliales bacterium]
MLLSKKTILALVIFCFHTLMTLEARPLNILFVVAYFPAPSQTYILNMMTGLIDKGHNVSIFAFRKNDVTGHPNIAQYSLMDSVIYGEFPAELPECDIIFCQSGALGRKIIAMESLSDWIKGKKLIVCLRGMDVTSNAVRNNPEIYEELFKVGDLFLPVCDYFKKLLIQFGCDPNKIIVYHSAINCTQFFFKERKNERKKGKTIHLVSVCRLIQKKGLDFAIKAVARLSKKYNNIHFTIVGSGHLRHFLERLVKDLGLNDKVTFFGWATQDQVVNILDSSHIFLLPSTTSAKGDEEGIANALKEAMAMGLISIGTVHAGTPELIEDGVSGFLVPQKTSKLLAKKIKYVIKHPEIWKPIGLAARKKVEDEFEIKKSIEELERIFYGIFYGLLI